MTDFKNLAEADGNYIIRVKTPSGATVTAFARACALVASNFREEWEVTMDQFGNLVSLNYVPKVAECAGANTPKVSDTVQFETNVKLSYPWRGIRPEVKPGHGSPMAPAQGASSGGDSSASSSSSSEGADGEPQEEQSFLRKYWLYIAIPVVFLMMNGVPPEEGAAGGASGPRQAPRRRPAGSA